MATNRSHLGTGISKMSKMTNNRNNRRENREIMAKAILDARIRQGQRLLRRTLICLALAIILLILIATHAIGAPITRALNTAQHYWGPTRCQGPIEVDRNTNPPTPATPGTEVQAWVLFSGIPGGFLNWNSPTYNDCIINLTPNALADPWPEFCQIMLHEYGHFLGWADSTTAYPPTDIRYPVMTLENRPRICATLRRSHSY